MSGRIQVQWLVGPTAGQRVMLTGPTVSFGRGGENQLVVVGQFVSRRHGELRIEKDRWVLANESPNGTSVSRRKVRGKPLELRDGDVVSVGGQDVFQVVQAMVQPEAASPPPAPVEQPTTAAPVSQRMTRKTKLWLGIAVYLVLMLGVMVVLRSFAGKEDRSIQTAARLTPEQIASEVRRPLPKVQPDPRRARAELQRARELLEQKHTRAAATYEAYRAYQESLRYAGVERFDEGLDQLRFQQTQQDIIDDLTRRYEAAYVQLTAGNFRDAVAGFLEVAERFPDTSSLIYQNAHAQRGKAKGYEKQR